LVVGVLSACGSSDSGEDVEREAVSEGTVEPWPGEDSIIALDDPASAIGKNASGITYQPVSITGTGIAWVVRNNPEMAHKMIKEADSGKWLNANTAGWANGKELRLPRSSPENPDGNRAPDSEGVTKAEWDDDALYVVSERLQRPKGKVGRQSILRYETNTPDSVLYATHEWIVTEMMPTVGSNDGLESLTWVPDRFLVDKRFRDMNNELYNPDDYPNHGAGLFFAGLEDSGQVYVYALNQKDDSDFDLILEFHSGLRPNIMALEFDRDTGLLWAGCDDNCGNEISVLALREGAFKVAHRYSRPDTLENLNNEGIALFPEAECADGTKQFLWIRDDGGDGTSMFRDLIPCGAGDLSRVSALTELSSTLKLSKHLSGSKLKATVGCDLDCTTTLAGTVRIKTKGRAGAAASQINSKSLDLIANQSEIVKLKLKPRARKDMKRALRRGHKVKAAVRLRAKDAAGGVERMKVGVRLRYSRAFGKPTNAVDYQVCGYATVSSSAVRSTATSGSIESNPVIFRKTKKRTPGKVVKLKVLKKEITQSQAKVTWKRPKSSGASRITKYQTQIKTGGKKWNKWKSAKPKTLKAKNKYVKTYKDLKPGTTYQVQVRATNKKGPGKNNKTNFATSCAPPPAPKPRPVHVPSYSYSYNVKAEQYNGVQGNPPAQDSWFSENGDLFQDIETTQFVDQIPDFLTVRAPAGDQCLSIFDGFGGTPFTTIKANGTERVPVKPPNTAAPQQLTIIPWKSKSGGCDISKDFKAYDSSTVISIFVSKTYFKSPPSNAVVCKISAQDAQEINQMVWGSGGSNAWKSGDCVIDKPMARGSSYTGTLHTMLTSDDTRPLYIELAPNATLTAPLNGIVAGTSDPQGTGYDRCVLAPQRKIIVTGFGRLDGSEVNKQYQNMYDGKEKPAEYLVSSGQLVLGSQATTTPAIDVSGISAANGPVRNEASVSLNDGNYEHCGPNGQLKTSTSGYLGGPVKVFDFKRPGTWWDASDALEVSKGSQVSFAYLHSADDAIKISAPSQQWKNITVLQGNAGSAVNIGSYGYNSGTSGTTVDGVFIPRITQILSNGLAQWDDRGGVITTRTCAQPNQLDGSQNVTGVTIKNVTLEALGGNPAAGKGPNSYVRPFAIGVLGTKGPHSFCQFSDSSETSDVTIGDFEFTNFDFYQVPLKDTLFYDGNVNKATSWLPVRFCSGTGAVCTKPPGPTSSENRPVTFWPAGTREKPGYYVCGATPATKCWTTANLKAPSGLDNSVNVEYTDDSGATASVDGKVGFPYGP